MSQEILLQPSLENVIWKTQLTKLLVFLCKLTFPETLSIKILSGQSINCVSRYAGHLLYSSFTKEVTFLGPRFIWGSLQHDLPLCLDTTLFLLSPPVALILLDTLSIKTTFSAYSTLCNHAFYSFPGLQLFF